MAERMWWRTVETEKKGTTGTGEVKTGLSVTHPSILLPSTWACLVLSSYLSFIEG